jgi:hypothetical protein
VVATVTFNDEAEPFAGAAVLRPGNAPAHRGARGLLRRLRSVRRIVLHLPMDFPWLPTWRQLARAVGATS